MGRRDLRRASVGGAHSALEETAAAEVIRHYARGMRAAKGLASAIRADGHPAEPHGGPIERRYYVDFDRCLPLSGRPNLVQKMAKLRQRQKEGDVENR